MEVKNIRLCDISLSQMNPRKTIDQASIEELAANIKQQGLLQPLTVRPIEYNDFVEDGEIVSLPVKYEIVCGERRYRASAFNKAEEVPCIVRDLTDAEAFDAMITENLQREDVDVIEEAFAFEQLLKNGSKAEDIAARFGKSIRFVQDRLKLNNLIEPCKKALKEERLTITGAMLVSKMDIEMQEEFAEKLHDEISLSTNEVKRWFEYKMKMLSNAMWMNDNEEEKWTEEFPLCKECQFNTSNHGCLFYEMKGNSQCTNAKCFIQKTKAYIMYLLSKENLVHEGEELDFSKSVIIEPDTYYQDDGYKEFIAEIKKKGYKVINADKTFNYNRCWYDDGDERIDELVAKSKVCRCISVYDYRTPSFKVEYFYTSNIEPSEENKGLVAKRLKNEYETFISREETNISERLRDFVRKHKVAIKTEPLTDFEKQILYRLMLLQCNSDWKKEACIADGCDKEFLEEYPEKINMIFRRFIYDNIQEWNLSYSKSGQGILHDYTEEFFKKEYESLKEKSDKKIDDKRREVIDKLKELGFDKSYLN